MTISSDVAKNQSVANGSQTVFVYQFKIFDQAELEVYLGDALQASGFSVSNVGNDNGGNVTFSVPPPNGTIVTRQRKPPLTQPLDLPTQGAFPSDSVEAQLDKLVMQIQYLKSLIDRSLLLAVSSTLTGLALPTPQAGKAIGWDAEADGFTNLEPNSGALASSYMATVLAAADAAAAQIALGGTTVGKSLFTAASDLAARQAIGAFANERVATKTGAYTVEATDCGKLIPVDATGGIFAVTLQAAGTAGSGFTVGFRKIDNSYNAVTVDANAAETINGLADFLLTDQWETLWLMCNGASWEIISSVPGAHTKDGIVLDERTGLSGVAAADFFKHFADTRFRRLVWEVTGWFPASADSAAIRLSTDGSAFISADYYAAGLVARRTVALADSNAAAATLLTITGSIGNTNATKANIRIELNEPHSTTIFKTIRAESHGSNASSDPVIMNRIGQYAGAASAILGLRLIATGGGNFSVTSIVQRGYR